MNRREFGKTALGVTAAAIITPAAFAAQRRTIKDCIVIDYEKHKMRWRYLKEPDYDGRTFVYEESSSMASFRHFEFFGSDGLVVGISAPMAWWTHCYDAFEKSFVYVSRPATGKNFTHSEFLSYVNEVRDSLNGRIVPIEELA